LLDIEQCCDVQIFGNAAVIVLTNNNATGFLSNAY
jgi:hypothetical protein